MNKSEVFLLLSGGVKTERGRKILRRGDTLPEDVLPGEAERLRELGALGVPAAPASESKDEADVMLEAIEAEIEEAGTPEPVSPEPEPTPEAEPEPAPAAMPDPDADEAPAAPEAEEETPAPVEDTVGLVAYVKAADDAEVLDRAEKAEPAERAALLEAAREASGTGRRQKRASLVKGLEALLEDE